MHLFLPLQVLLLFPSLQAVVGVVGGGQQRRLREGGEEDWACTLF